MPKKEKTKKGSPTALVKGCMDGMSAFTAAAGNEKKAAKALGEVTKSLESMKVVLYGDEKIAPSKSGAQELTKAMFGRPPVTSTLVPHLADLDFEARKDYVVIFNNLFRREIEGRQLSVDHILANPDVLSSLLDGCRIPEIAVNAGSMLRTCLESLELAKSLLHSPNFNKFFELVEESNFDVASDGFTSFKDMLAIHKPLVAEFLEDNYDSFFESYMKLLHSENYVTRRQSLKLLGELLLDRANFNVMTRFISDEDNLKLMMNLLRDKSKNIQFEAFHVFKVFVANPNKARPILEILIMNKPRLRSFLANFHKDKDDDQFADEKEFLLKQIDALPDSI